MNKLIIVAALFLGLCACEKPFEYNADEISYFEPLPAPPDGEGYQLHVPPFPVPADFEREWFMRVPFGNTDEVFISSFETKCRPGTHHLIGYGYENEDDPNNPDMWVMSDQNRPDGELNLLGAMGGDQAYFISQAANFSLELPEGIAIRVPANASIELNSHYFNKTQNTLFGEVYLNAYTITKEEVTEVLEIGSVDNDYMIDIPPKATTMIEYTDLFEEKTNIRMMVSHMHKRGILFDAFLVGGPRDGEQIYSAWDYQHPPTLFFEDEPLVIQKGEGIRTQVTYKNETNRTIKYGVTSEDEMGILFYMASN